MLTMVDVLNSWGTVSDISRLLEDYRLETWDSKTGERYIIESATNSGLAFNAKGFVKVYLSGVTYEKYYEEELEVNMTTDLIKLLDDLFKKEKLNKDRLSNMKVFFDDLRLRNKVKEEVSSL